jgi:glutathione peroxidase
MHYNYYTLNLLIQKTHQMKTIITAFTILFVIGCKETTKKSNENMEAATTKTESVATNSAHSFVLNNIDGQTFSLKNFKGKKILIVNTASKCGYTPQYEGLQALYEKYKDKLVVVGFPCNDFGGQEPGEKEDIKSFCKKNYGVTFPLTEKISVKGETMAPIYQWLTQKSQNGVLDATIKWNFNKFLLNENGEMLAYFPSSVKPMDETITSKL